MRAELLEWLQNLKPLPAFLAALDGWRSSLGGTPSRMDALWLLVESEPSFNAVWQSIHAIEQEIEELEDACLALEWRDERRSADSAASAA